MLLRDVVAFLRARPEWRAPSGLVVDAFQDRVGPTQHALFRRLLKVAATLEKNPPNAAGRGGALRGCSRTSSGRDEVDGR